MPDNMLNFQAMRAASGLASARRLTALGVGESNGWQYRRALLELVASTHWTKGAAPCLLYWTPSRRLALPDKAVTLWVKAAEAGRTLREDS